jgi:hypothetical protein
MDKHPTMSSKYYDDPIITSQGTIILEENVETYIRNIQKEEIKKIIEINKKHEEEEREKDSIREEKKKIDSFAYYEDPIMTSQGIIIQQENVDSHYKQLNKEKRKELIKNGKHKKKVKITVFKNVRVI